MKILVALIAIALAATLLVSATMGADTLVPGGGSAKSKPGATMNGGVAGKARLMPIGLAPLTVKGSGFKSGETVTLRSTESPVKTRRTVKASAAGQLRRPHGGRRPVQRHDGGCHGQQGQPRELQLLRGRLRRSRDKELAG